MRRATPWRARNSRFRTPSLESISSDAWSARAASSSLTTGAPNTAMTASPMNFSTVPPQDAMAADIAEKYASRTERSRSGSSRSPSSVEPMTSANRIDTSLRSSAARSTGRSDAPHPGQNSNPSGLSRAQFAQVTTAGVYVRPHNSWNPAATSARIGGVPSRETEGISECFGRCECTKAKRVRPGTVRTIARLLLDLVDRRGLGGRSVLEPGCGFGGLSRAMPPRSNSSGPTWSSSTRSTVAIRRLTLAARQDASGWEGRGPGASGSFSTVGRNAGIPLGERHALRAGDHLFDDLRCADDRGALRELFFGDPARLGARAAQPYLAAVVDELAVQLGEHRQACLCDPVSSALGSQPHGFDRAEHDRFLPRGRGDVRRNERQSRALGISLAVGAVEDQLVAHLIVPFPRSPGGVHRPEPRSNEQRGPSSERAEAGPPSPPDPACSPRARGRPGPAASAGGTRRPGPRRTRDLQR